MFENSSATRYVKKISANPEMAHNKILARIKNNSKVLEFGPASGVMTQVMAQKLNCKVSIVEIDADCFKNAIQYAVDGSCSDIESFEWENSFTEDTFDYIIFTDVLEHLFNPEEVLKHAGKYLKEDGSILISVPNIAHNSVIIQLLKNQFIYQSTGILDYTHIRHFTYSELQKVCMSVGYSTIYMDAVYIGVGKNEFPDSYGDIDQELADALKRRPFGEAYQHIIEIKKKRYVEENNIKIDNRLGQPAVYTEAVVESLVENENKTVRDAIADALCTKPNVFFENNHEIARMRMEINELYSSELTNEQYYATVKRLNELQEEIKVKNRFINRLNLEIQERDKRIVVLQDEEDKRNVHIRNLDEQIINLENRCHDLTVNNNFLEKQQQYLDEQVKTLEEKEEVLKQHKEILEEKNNIIQEENSDLKQKLQMSRQVNLELQQVKTNFENLVQELDLLKNVKKENEEIQKKNRLYEQEKQNFIQEIRNKEGHIELLLESERELERYKNTKDYQKMLRKRERIDKLLPPSSKRLFILRVLKKMITEPGVMIRVIQPGNIGNYFKYLKSDSIEEIQSRYDELLDIAQGTNSAVMIKMQNSGVVTNQNSSKGVAHKVEDYEMLCFTEQERPLVSIIIPVYNQFDYTYNCLKSILTNSGDVSYEVIIANDCSTDITRDIEQVVKNVRLITTESNVRFLLNCNNAAKYARGQYILFLNNDTQVMENWLKPLIQVMDTYEDVGMVGSKLIYPDGRLQEAGGIVWKDASAWNYGHLKNPDDPEYVYLKEVDYVSGAAIMIRTKLWKEIGGFDERFVPAYYEDTDLAFEVRKHGYKVMMQPKSLVVHFEGVSNGTDTSTGLKAYQVANNQKFYDKWKDVLEKENFENGQDVFLAKDRGQLKKQILVVDHYVPNYDKDAGGRCTYMYIKMFLKMGLKVTFIGDNFAHPEPYTSELNGLGVEILYGNDYYNNWKIWLKDNLHYFDYIYLQRPHISIKYIDIVKKYGRGKIFYFAHDLHHVRMYRDYLLTGDDKALEESEKWKKIEMELFDKTDVGHVVGSYEQAIMQKVFPNKPIRNIPLYIYDEMPEGIEKDFAKRSDILFVGGFGHTPNIDAVLWFYENVYTRVLRKYPDMVWHIVGSKAPDEVLKLAGPNVIIEGFVSDEDLAKLYKKCRMSVVPLRYGAGVKGKVVESAYYQIPLVTTPIGGEGLDDSTDAFVMEEDAEKMAELICNLYEDYPRLRKMSDAGIDFISTYFTSKVAEQVLVQDM